MSWLEQPGFFCYNLRDRGQVPVRVEHIAQRELDSWFDSSPVDYLPNNRLTRLIASNTRPVILTLRFQLPNSGW